VLSPLYKPTPEDTRVQTVYDTAQIFTKGAQELHDLVKTLDAMMARPATPAQKQELLRVQQGVLSVTDRLGQTSQLLAESLRSPRTRR
jgi:phospholipid/cholesterol/gamma-HCH transport system substrate-binding protein